MTARGSSPATCVRRLQASARPSRALFVLASVATLVALAVTPACTAVEPVVGDPLPACVDVDSNPKVDVSFKNQIRPLMAGTVPGGPKPCANCHYHSGGTMEGLMMTGFDLETLGSLKKGGRNTFDDIIVPGKPCESSMLQKVQGTYQSGARMPKGGPYMTPEQIQLLVDWVAEGAKGADTD